jgi:2-(1,2-epoxy-1,2-dihydrophenyl)acetyl-CoA isomerase
MMLHEPLSFTIADGVARLVMESPANRNAVTAAFARRFSECCRLAATDLSVRVILLRGRGPFFSPGGDIREFLEQEHRIGEHVAELTDGIHAGIHYLVGAPAPVVVGLNGVAAGGGLGLVLAGDYVIARDDAKLNCAYTRTGLTPDAGVTWFLANRLSHNRAFELAALNETVDAARAEALGLINRVVPADAFEAELEAVVARFAAMPEGVLATTKRLLRHATESSLETQLEREAEAIIGRVELPATVAALKKFAAGK